MENVLNNRTESIEAHHSFAHTNTFFLPQRRGRARWGDGRRLDRYRPLDLFQLQGRAPKDDADRFWCRRPAASALTFRIPRKYDDDRNRKSIYIVARCRTGSLTVSTRIIFYVGVSCWSTGFCSLMTLFVFFVRVPDWFHLHDLSVNDEIFPSIDLNYFVL